MQSVVNLEAHQKTVGDGHQFFGIVVVRGREDRFAIGVEKGADASGAQTFQRLVLAELEVGP